MSSTPGGGPPLEESCFCKQGTEEPFDLDRVFDSLAHPRRREIICLLDEESEWTRGRLVENLVEGSSLPGWGPLQTVETNLYHHHLPKLDEAGLISVEDDYRVVQRGEHYPLVREMIEAAASLAE